MTPFQVAHTTRCTQFSTNWVKICVTHKVCVVNDPRPSSPYNKMYTVQYLGNMVNGDLTLYNNQPVEVLKQLAAAAIKNGDVSSFYLLC